MLSHSGNDVSATIPDTKTFICSTPTSHNKRLQAYTMNIFIRLTITHTNILTKTNLKWTKTYFIPSAHRTGIIQVIEI